MTVSEHIEAAQIVRERRARRDAREAEKAQKAHGTIHACEGDAQHLRCPHFDPLPSRRPMESHSDAKRRIYGK